MALWWYCSSSRLGLCALFFDADQFRPRVEAALTKALNRETHIGKLSLRVLRQRVDADSLSIAEDPAFGNTPFIQAKSFGLEVGALGSDSVAQTKYQRNRDRGPAIALIQDTHGVWNYATLGSSGARSPGSNGPAAANTAPDSPGEISIAQLHISGAKLTVGKTVLEKTDIVATDITPTTAFPFTVTGKVASGGEFRMEGQSRPVSFRRVHQRPRCRLRLKVGGKAQARSVRHGRSSES